MDKFEYFIKFKGIYPFYFEPSIIVVLTDGRQFTSPEGVQENVN
jgi:hypothetical protein